MELKKKMCLFKFTNKGLATNDVVLGVAEVVTGHV